MYQVLQKFQVSDKVCIFVEGNTQLLKNGLLLKDENENIFIIKSIGMVKYKKIEDNKKYAVLLLTGDTEKIGKSLTIIEKERSS